MQLVIDIGNTRIKIALFNKWDVFVNAMFTSKTELIQYVLANKHQIQKCIIASVTNNEEELAKTIKQHIPTLIFTSQTTIPIKNSYTTSSTLGSDRLAAAIGGWAIYPNQNTLVVDIGTCIKYNFTSKQNKYLGGAISPGQRLRYRSLNDYTAKLPLQEFDQNYEKVVGNNTKESILSGVQIGMLYEIEGFIMQYMQLYSNLNVILTGGDAAYFAKHIKKSIFVDDLLILKGLNQVLLFQS